MGSLALAALLSMGAGADHEEPVLRDEKVAAAEVRQEVRQEVDGDGRDGLTGDWGRLRTRMVENGIDFNAGYIGEVLGNLSGGIRRGARYHGLLELSLELDTARLGLWEGGSLFVSSIYPHGPMISEEYLGDLLTASNIDAYDSFRLYELSYEQRFWDGRFSFRAGQMVADNEFAYTETGGYFLSGAFGWPAFIFGNVLNGGPAYHVAGLGARVRAEPGESFFLQAGIFDGDPFDSPTGDPRVNRGGTRIHLSREQGLFAIAEGGIRTHAGENASGLPGTYKAGAWMHTADFPSNLRDERGEPFVLSGNEPRIHSSNYGVFIAAEQMLWREEGEQGLYAFLRGGVSPRDRSFFEAVVDGGFTLKGFVPSRPKDVLGLGAIYARVSRDLRRSEQLDAARNNDDSVSHSDHETVFEATYLLQLTRWLTLQPDFQWIFHPGANRSAADAVVLGLRATLVF